MKRYAVEVTDAAMASIRDLARYIAIEQAQPDNAQRWLTMLWDAVEGLETFPNGRALADENHDVDYEVRFVLAGHESLLFTVDEGRETVWVIALRGQGRLPRSEELPRSIDAIEAQMKGDEAIKGDE